MTVGEARLAARDWLFCHRDGLAGYAGAYFAGSLIELDEDGMLSPASDLDIMLVFDGPAPPKIGKLEHRGVLLDIGAIESHALLPVERALSTHFIAYALHINSVVDDPLGWLGPLQRAVEAGYAEEKWVRARVCSILNSIRAGISAWREDAPMQDQAIAWAFSTGRTAHMMLAAALENCTVRTRYEKARAALGRLGMNGYYPPLLAMLVGTDVPSLPRHMDELAVTFDLTARLDASGFPFAGDMAPASRRAAIDESRRMLLGPYPGEAAFWMAVTFARCHQVLAARAPALNDARMPALLTFLEALGIGQPAAIGEKLRTLEAYLPQLERAAYVVIAANPAIRHAPEEL